MAFWCTICTLLALTIAVFWFANWVFHVIAVFYGRWKLHQKTCQLPREKPYPGVSIIKPIVGVDPNLLSNLETFFTMSYPLYEIRFCIHYESDPCIVLVKRLVEKYPHVDCSIFVGGPKIGINPKINNVQQGYVAAKYELILLSDSRIRMKEDTLMDMVNHMGEKVGLVHQMPFVCDRDGFSATLEKIYFGTYIARIYSGTDLINANCASGMSSLMRKRLIDEVGGLEAFESYLCEDYFIAQSILDRGWKLAVSSQPAWQNDGTYAVSLFQARLKRWAQLRIASAPTTIVLEPLSECMVIGATAAWAASWWLQWDPLVFYVVHVLVWFLMDYILLSLVQNSSLPFSKFEFVVGWLFRECYAPFLFMRALWDPIIHWRAGTFKLRWGGIAEEIKPKMKL